MATFSSSHLFPRWFEVRTIKDRILILSEPEIEKYRDKIAEIRTELTEKEVREINPQPLTDKLLKLLELN